MTTSQTEVSAATIVGSSPAERPASGRWVKILTGAFLMTILMWFIDWPQFAKTIRALDMNIFMEMIGLSLVSRGLRAWKWNVLLAARNIRIGHWQALRMSLISHFAGSWTPGQLGGDAYRLVALRRFGKSDVVLSTLLIERYAGLLGVCLFSLLSLPLTIPLLLEKSASLTALVLATMAMILLVLVCLLIPGCARMLGHFIPGLRTTRVGDKVRGFYRNVMEFKNYPAALMLFLASNFAEILSYFVINYLSARALGLDVNIWFFLAAMPLVHLALRIPISFQAVGVQEGCFVFALVQHGFSPAEGMAVSLVQRLLEVIVSIVPGGLLLWLTPGLDLAPPPGNSEPTASVRT